MQKLINDINAANQKLAEAAAMTVQLAHELGVLLLRLKDETPHGQFTTVVTDHTSVSVRQAQRYMKLAAAYPGGVPEGATGISHLLKEASVTKNDAVSVLPECEINALISYALKADARGGVLWEAVNAGSNDQVLRLWDDFVDTRAKAIPAFKPALTAVAEALLIECYEGCTERPLKLTLQAS